MSDADATRWLVGERVQVPIRYLTSRPIVRVRIACLATQMFEVVVATAEYRVPNVIAVMPHRQVSGEKNKIFV